MQSSTRKSIACPTLSNDDNPTGLAGLIRAPWAITIESFENLISIYAAHLRSPKVDIEAFEKRTGFSLATPRADYQVDRGVAVISFDGLIAPKANLLTRVCGATSAQWVAGQVNAAIADPLVKSIILVIDSPGGSVSGSPELAQIVFDAARKKPVVAYSDGMLLSAAYWIGSAANAVYISGPTVHVGSIGIVATHSHDPASSLGQTEIVAGRYKRIATSLAPLSAAGAAYMQDQVNYLYEVFVNAVALYRGVTPEHAAAHMAEGRMFIGKQAIDAGLVDEISPLGALVSAMASNPGAFAKRRRITGHRAIGARAQGTAPKQLTSQGSQFIAPRVLTANEQADAAVAYSKQHGIGIVQALKTLGFAT
ncbi:S49 family peptidase [Rhodoferax sp.]|uniref:S49 family peptidase n=1 Tax=Rhodoferax sp. TaxID=50421 RepID=UPI00261C5875|nr:S49 family peptidase [Rhodoferax sp.]MDD3936856.1 S49 family peptidase [Rhodoferax sp.]